jgi:hypothetical protein
MEREDGHKNFARCRRNFKVCRIYLFYFCVQEYHNLIKIGSNIKKHRLPQRAVDVWDSALRACGTYGKHFAQRGFGFILLPGRVHACTQASREDRTRQAANR